MISCLKASLADCTSGQNVTDRLVSWTVQALDINLAQTQPVVVRDSKKIINAFYYYSGQYPPVESRLEIGVFAHSMRL